MVALRVSPSGRFVEVADVAPLSSVMWVDADTDIVESDQNGSIGAPFATLQAANNALPAVGGTILVVPSVASPGAVNTVAQLLTIAGVGVAASVELGGAVQSTGAVVLATCTALGVVTTGTATLRDAAASSVESDAGVILERSAVAGAIETPALEAVLSTVGGAVTATSSILSKCSVYAAPVELTGNGVLSSLDDEFGSTVTVDEGTIDSRGSSFAGDISVSAGLFDDCTLTGPETIDAVGVLHFKDCTIETADTVIEITSAGGNCRSTTIQGNWDSGAELQIDAFSFAFAAISGGHSVSSDNTTFLDGAIRATVPIVVPAVADGAVGYVDTTLVGTAVEDVFSVAGAAVQVNPTTDLVAAGAGGGFLNARISAPNTLRCAFIGPLAGGSQPFTVSRSG